MPKDDWACCEIYEGDFAATAPMPIIRPTMNRPAKALLQKADELLKLGYIEAAANYARQAFEMGMRIACELKKIKMEYRLDPAAHQAQDFLDKLKDWPGSANVPKAEWDAAIHRLELLKKRGDESLLPPKRAEHPQTGSHRCHRGGNDLP